MLQPHYLSRMREHSGEWSGGGSDLGMSSDESTNGSSHDSIPRERSQQASEYENENENPKSQLVALAMQVDVSELELQTLRKQIVEETKRGQDLSREVISLKEDRDALKLECEKFKSFQKTAEELRQELNYEKDLNANLRLQLQKTQDSNAQLILAVQDLEDMLKQKNRQSRNGANNEFKRQSQQSSDCWATISELEYYYMENLQEEMKKQAQGFEQEQRSIRAEELLHEKAEWKNANTTAVRLLEEFKRLSVQMASTFVANEKASMKALAEASELRLWKTTLEEMLQKANEEIQLVRDEYEAKLCDLSSQLISKTNHVEQMMSEIDVKSNELEHQRKHEEDISRDLSKEILGLKVEIESLAKVNTILYEKTEEMENLRNELKQMKASIEEAELLARRRRGRRGGGDVERNELLCTIALARKEAENSQEEVKQMKSIQVEKEKEIEDLRSELHRLESQRNDLEHSLFEEKTEKEKLRKQASQLKGNLKKKEDAFNSIEKKLKDSRTKRRATNSDATKITSRNNKSSPVSNGTKEVANLREKIKSLEGQIKLKENALETSTNSFLEKEMDLLNKIEELGSRVNELCDYEVQKGAKDLVGVSSNDAATESGACKYGENANAGTSIKSGEHLITKKEMNVCGTNNRDCNFNELLTELVSLKERNGTMESELKEMQERYSEISLKFAQVEGERQQLVITVRNLKNSMKN